MPPPGSPLDLAMREEGQESLAMRSGRRGVQEIASAPGAISGLYGLAGAAIDKFAKGEPWGDAVLSDEGKQLITEAEAGDEEARRIIAEHPEAVLRTGLQSAMEWYKWGGDIAGVTNNPDGSVPLDEEVGGVLLSTAATLPASIFSKPAAAINRVTNTAVRTGLKVALRGVELATPMTVLDPAATVTRKGAIMGANLGVGIAVNDATRALAEEPTVAGMLIQQDREDSITSGSVTPVTGVPDAEAGDSGSEVAATGAAVAGLGALGLALRPGGAARLARGAAQAGSAPTGAVAAMGSKVRRVGATLTNDAGLLVDDVRTTVGKAEAEQYDTMLTALTRHSNEATYQRYTTLGLLGQDGEFRVPPKTALDNAHASLTPQQKEIFQLGMSARHERAERGLAQPKPRLPVSDTELQIRIDAATNDPKIKQVMDAYDQTVRGVARWEHAVGGIDAPELARRSTRAFVPQIEAADLVKGVRSAKRKVQLWASRMQGKTLDPVEIEGGGGIREPADAMSALAHYMRDKTSKVNEMQARRAYLNMIADAPDTSFKNGVRSVVRVRDAAHAKTLKGYAIKVPVDGKMQEFRVADPRTKRLLEFQPHAVSPTNEFLRRTFQKFTTGNFNPLFAPTALMYDAMFGMLAANTDKVVSGFLDQGLVKVGAPSLVRAALAPVTRAIDTPLLVFEGIIEGGMGRYRQMIAEKMAQNVQMLGGNVTPVAAARAADAFLKTKYGLMHLSGYSSNSFASDIEKLNRVERVLNKTGYVDMLDTIRDAYRMGLFSRNVAAAKMALPPGDTISRATYDQITKHVRDVASDPSRRGTVDWFNKTLSGIPYGGVMVHSVSHLFAQWKNPAAYSVVLGVTAAKWYSEATMSPEARDYVQNKTPDYARIANMYVELPHEGEPFDAGKHLITIGLAPELGGLTTIASTLFSGMFGEDTSVETPMGQRIIGAVGELFSLGVPVLANIATSALGYGQINVGGLVQRGEPFREPFEDGGLSEQRGTGLNQGIITDRVYNLLVSALGTSGRIWGEAAEVMDSQVEKYDRGYFDAMDRVFDVVREGYVDKQIARYNLFDQSKLVRPLGTHSSSRAYEIDGALERMTTVMRALHPTLNEPLDADIPFSKLITEMPQKLSNKVLQKQGTYVAEYFGSPMHARQMDEISQLRKSYRRMQGNKDKAVPLRVVNHSLNRANDMMMERYGIVLDEYGEFETFMREKFDDPDWTLDSFVDAVDDNLRRRHAS